MISKSKDFLKLPHFCCIPGKERYALFKTEATNTQWHPLPPTGVDLQLSHTTIANSTMSEFSG